LLFRDFEKSVALLLGVGGETVRAGDPLQLLRHNVPVELAQFDVPVVAEVDGADRLKIVNSAEQNQKLFQASHFG
jgi:hypothetical protein